MQNIDYYIPEGCRIRFNYRPNYFYSPSYLSSYNTTLKSVSYITDLERNLIVGTVQEKVKSIISSSIQLNSYGNIECDLIILTPDQLSQIIRSVEVYSYIKQKPLNEDSNSNKKVSSLTSVLLSNYNEEK